MTWKEILIGMLFFIVVVAIINWLIPKPWFNVQSSVPSSEIREEGQCTWGNDCW
jgi:hypothetical protein